MKWLSVLAVLVLGVVAFAQTEERQTTQQIIDASNMYKAGNVPGATAAFEQLSQKAPNNPDVLSWLGFLYLQQNRPADAVPVLEHAATVRPKDLEILTNLGN